jgi:hypothetical protein
VESGSAKLYPVLNPSARGRGRSAAASARKRGYHRSIQLTDDTEIGCGSWWPEPSHPQNSRHCSRRGAFARWSTPHRGNDLLASKLSVYQNSRPLHVMIAFARCSTPHRRRPLHEFAHSDDAILVIHTSPDTVPYIYELYVHMDIGTSRYCTVGQRYLSGDASNTRKFVRHPITDHQFMTQ